MRVTRHPDLLEDVLQPNSMMPDTDVGVAWLLISSPRISPPPPKGSDVSGHARQCPRHSRRLLTAAIVLSVTGAGTWNDAAIAASPAPSGLPAS